MSKIAKVLKLEIEYEEPMYDEEGKPIIDENEAMLSTPYYLQGIFNADLLADDPEDDQNRSSQDSSEKQQINYEPPEDIEADFKKHVNVD